MPEKAPKGDTKSLNDGDIATFARREGPDSGVPGTDVDTHSDSDAPAAATDHDASASTDDPSTDNASTDNAHTDKDD